MEYIDMLELMVKGIELGKCDRGEGIVDTGGMEGKGENRISLILLVSNYDLEAFLGVR